MQYTKMHGAGNDFIILNNMVEKIPQASFSAIAQKLCARRTSIGADGMMFVDKPQGQADFKMHFYNADGTAGEMCGNGARCICRYGYEKKLSGEEQRVETVSGRVLGWRIDDRTYEIRLNEVSRYVEALTLTVEGAEYQCTYVELGSPGLPHLVVHIPEFNAMNEKDLFEIGKALRGHEKLSKGANVNFYYIDAAGEIIARTFERGVENFTLACGTGAGSVGYVLSKQQKRSAEAFAINMPGGRLDVRIVDHADGTGDIFLSGPATMVSEGFVLDEDLIY